jgi:hypothetical protein
VWQVFAPVTRQHRKPRRDASGPVKGCGMRLRASHGDSILGDVVQAAGAQTSEQTVSNKNNLPDRFL